MLTQNWTKRNAFLPTHPLPLISLVSIPDACNTAPLDSPSRLSRPSRATLPSSGSGQANPSPSLPY